MICTIANYEYIFNYNFHTDGSIQVETRLSGILNLYIKEAGEANPYGVEVAPKVNAHYHQHLFSLRIDPMVDGCENTVMQTDVAPLPFPTGSKENHLGNGFVTHKTLLEQAGGYDWDPQRHRTFSIINPSKRHYASGLPVGYKIHTKDFEPLVVQPDSQVAQRAAFATKPLWITPFDEEQLWPAGKYVPQTRGAPADSIGNWVADRAPTADTDVVVWLTYGITHIPRPEDFPVMPVEHLNVWLKPSNFFSINPAHDLPASQDPYSRNAFSANGGGLIGTNLVTADRREAVRAPYAEPRSANPTSDRCSSAPAQASNAVACACCPDAQGSKL